MSRNLDYFTRRIREELRAEGSDGQGYTDFFIVTAINNAIQSLSEVFTIRDSITFNTTIGVREYDLKTLSPGVEIVTVLFVTHGLVTLTPMPLNTYLTLTAPEEGTIDRYVIWGSKLLLTGDITTVEELTVWIMRTPNRLEDLNDEPDTPSYMDEAIVYYTISACFRESRDYERAAYYQELFTRERTMLVRRQIPQTQRTNTTGVREVYSSAVTSKGRNRTSDTNPGGRY